jgi:hypothetical protein
MPELEASGVEPTGELRLRKGIDGDSSVLPQDSTAERSRNKDKYTHHRREPSKTRKVIGRTPVGTSMSFFRSD